MTIQRRQHSGAFKAKTALEAIRGERTVNKLAADYGVHPVQMTQWKRVARLMREMGIEALYTKPKLSQPTAGHDACLLRDSPIFPYFPTRVPTNFPTSPAWSVADMHW